MGGLTDLLTGVGVPVGALIMLWWSMTQSLKHIERHIHDIVHKELDRHSNGKECNGE